MPPHFIRTMRRLLLAVIAGLLGLFSLASAQDAPPLTAPLLAVNTIDRDSILLYDINSEQVRELSLGRGEHFVWDFSPDGCRVLVTLWQGTQPGRLVSAALDGSDIRSLVQFDELPADRWGVWEPQWSPGAERIAFTMIRDQADGSGELTRTTHTAWVTPDDPTPQFYSVTGREHTPRWSPDGSWLAYVSYDDRIAGVDVFATAAPTPEPLPGQTPVPATELSEADIWVVSADGETKYRLTNFQTGSVSQPRWSPDGELVSFVYSPSANNDMIWMIGAQQGAAPTQLMYEWSLVLDNTWLPDGTQILASIRDFRDMSENRLWQVPLAGLADDTGTLYNTSLDLSHADYPRFSADGRYLAARSAYALALVDTQATRMQLIDVVGLDNSPPVWSPAGFTGEAACSQ